MKTEEGWKHRAPASSLVGDRSLQFQSPPSGVANQRSSPSSVTRAENTKKHQGFQLSLAWFCASSFYRYPNLCSPELRGELSLLDPGISPILPGWISKSNPFLRFPSKFPG